MLTSPSLLARAAVAPAVLMAAVLAVDASGATTPTGMLLATSAAVLVVVGALVLLVRPSFEAGLVLGLVAASVALGSVLAMTVGLPGASGARTGVREMLLLVLSVPVVLLLLVAARASSRAVAARATYPR